MDGLARVAVVRLLGCLLLTLSLQGCVSDDPLTQFNSWARIEFDGYPVGQAKDSSGQAISCERESDAGPLARLVRDDRWPEDPSEWLVEGSTEVGMDLGLPGAGREASIEFTIGDGIYRSDAGTRVTIEARPGDDGIYRDDSGTKVRIDGVVGGRAVFRDIPLERGTAFKGKQRLDRLVILWDCLGRGQPYRALHRRLDRSSPSGDRGGPQAHP